jgi:hypothetical protein
MANSIHHSMKSVPLGRRFDFFRQHYVGRGLIALRHTRRPFRRGAIMTQTFRMRLAHFLTATCLAVVGVSNQSIADPLMIPLPQGLACPDFGLTLEITSPDNRVEKTFFDKNGNPVRYLAAGKGNQLLFTNTTSGTVLSVRTGGSVEHVTLNRDGTQTWVTTGHEVLIMFPSDQPPGPTTTLYIGRLVFTIDPSNSNFTAIQSFTGKSTDICAALAG